MLLEITISFSYLGQRLLGCRHLAPGLPTCCYPMNVACEVNIKVTRSAVKLNMVLLHSSSTLKAGEGRNEAVVLSHKAIKSGSGCMFMAMALAKEGCEFKEPALGVFLLWCLSDAGLLSLKQNKNRQHASSWVTSKREHD